MRYLPNLIPKEFKVLPDYFKGSLYRSRKNNGFAGFLGWLFGIIFLLGALVELPHLPLAFFYGSLGILFLPPGHNRIEKVFRFRLRTRLKMVVCIVLFACASPLALHYGAIDRKQLEAEQAKAAREEKEKALAAQREQQRKDSLDFYILSSARQRGQHKPDEAVLQLQHATAFALSPDDKQRLDGETNMITQLRLEDMVAAGEYASAIPGLNELIEKNSNSADLLYSRALCYSKTGNIADAVHDCNAAADLGNPKATQLNDRINPVVKHITGYITMCCDGTTSSATGRGACSHHGGVCNWNSPIYEESRKYE